MKTGLAAWHYPHRDIINNIRFFTGKGVDVISFNGSSVLKALRQEGDKVAAELHSSGLELTLHFSLPQNRLEDTVHAFENDIHVFSSWQKKYGLIRNLTFDVPQSIRDNIAEFLDFVLENVPECKVGVEDFGLNDAELHSIEKYKDNDRFGYLVDIGHLYIRLRGQHDDKYTLFAHSDYEGAVNDAPDHMSFYKAFASKSFPVIEMHLHNNDGNKDNHLFLEDGTADMNAIARALLLFDYQGIITIESAPGYQFPCYGKQADEGILKTLHYWEDCLKKAKND